MQLACEMVRARQQGLLELAAPAGPPFWCGCGLGALLGLELLDGIGPDQLMQRLAYLKIRDTTLIAP